VAAVVTVLVTFNQNAYYHAQYSLAGQHAPFRKTDGGSDSEGRTIYFDHKTSRAKEVSVCLCLEPMTFTNKSKEDAELIPYQTDADGMTWSARPNSTEVYA